MIIFISINNNYTHTRVIVKIVYKLQFQVHHQLIHDITMKHNAYKMRYLSIWFSEFIYHFETLLIVDKKVLHFLYLLIIS